MGRKVSTTTPSSNKTNTALETGSLGAWGRLGKVHAGGATDEYPRSLTERYVIGTPDEVADRLQVYVALGVTHFMLWFMDFPGIAGVRLFAREVMPEFHAAEAEHAVWKQKVLAREIVLVDSGGICSPDIHKLKFTKLRRPIWPFDGVNDPYAGQRT